MRKEEDGVLAMVPVIEYKVEVRIEVTVIVVATTVTELPISVIGAFMATDAGLHVAHTSTIHPTCILAVTALSNVP